MRRADSVTVGASTAPRMSVAPRYGPRLEQRQVQEVVTQVVPRRQRSREDHDRREPEAEDRDDRRQPRASDVGGQERDQNSDDRKEQGDQIDGRLSARHNQVFPE